MEGELIQAVAQFIIEGFGEYISAFQEITRRAPQRFCERDWHGIQADSRERTNMYKKRVSRIARKVKRMLSTQYGDLDGWQVIRDEYEARTLQLFEYEIAQTFFNSVVRKVFDGIGADAGIMFVEDNPEKPEYESPKPIYRSYTAGNSLHEDIRKILLDYQFDAPFEDLKRDVDHVADSFSIDVLFMYRPDPDSRLDMLRSVFYRNKGAYLVGRLWIAGKLIPVVLPVLHGKNGLYVDAFIVEPDDVSIIFSFTRSHFMVDVTIPSELVRFLRSIIPQKRVGELYNSIGYSKHGKTEFYRNFLRHMRRSTDQFIIAPGIKGLVMAVFMLPSYHVVFKLIKDKADPPKQVTRGQVKAKYKLVSRHDRVGRMADTHEFQYFEFDKKRFSPELLAYLYDVAPSLMIDQDDKLIIKHLYTERQMTPLNIYLETASKADMEDVIEEYGNTIKQLAAANIFPGDMLLKNFGVTRHKRVVFYDYDEIGFLTEYNFREMPQAQSNEDLYASAPWFAVGEKDVFPREFEHFLIGKEGIKEIFYELHTDLFTVDFWKRMQQRQQEGEILDVFPYRRKQRFRDV